MNKREFIKKGAIGAVGICAFSPLVSANEKNEFYVNSPQLFNNLEALNVLAAYDALSKHYSESYTKAAKKVKVELIENNIQLNLSDIFQNATRFKKSTLVKTGDFYNHRLYWKALSPNKSDQISVELKTKIDADFSSMNNLKEALCRKAEQVNDESWIWIVYQDKSLKIVATEKYTNPYFSTVQPQQKGTPVLGIDLHSHSYKAFKNKYDYCQAYFELINWGFISKRYKKILNGKL